MKKYISKENLKIYDECPDYIPIDSGVADSVAKLLELGYETNSGHGGEYHPIVFLREDLDLRGLDDYKNNPRVKKIDVKEDGLFDCWIEKSGTCVYILFNEKYKFPNLPEGFVLYDNVGSEKYESVESRVEYFDSNGKRRDYYEIMREMEKKRKILKDWVDTLPENKNKRKGE